MSCVFFATRPQNHRCTKVHSKNKVQNIIPVHILNTIYSYSLMCWYPRGINWDNMINTNLLLFQMWCISISAISFLHAYSCLYKKMMNVGGRECPSSKWEWMIPSSCSVTFLILFHHVDKFIVVYLPVAILKIYKPWWARNPQWSGGTETQYTRVSDMSLLF